MKKGLIKNNVKIIGGIIVAAIILVAGYFLRPKNRVNLDFNKSYEVFVDGMLGSTADMYKMMQGLKVVEEKTNLTLSAKYQESKADINFKIKSQTENGSSNSLNDIDFLVDADYAENMKIKGSGSVSLQNMGDKLYIKINRLGADMGTGEQGAFLNAMLSSLNIVGKQFFVGQSGVSMSLSNVYTLPTQIMDLFKKNKIFDGGEKTTVNGYNAYPITLNKVNFSNFVADLLELDLFKKTLAQSNTDRKTIVEEIQKSMESISFKGYLVLESENTVALSIDSMIINAGQGSGETISIAGYLFGGKSNILIKSDFSNISMDLDKSRGGYSIKFEADLNDGTEGGAGVNLQAIININPSLQSTQLSTMFDGNMILNEKNASKESKTIFDMDFKGDSLVTEGTALNISEPKDSQDLQEFLESISQPTIDTSKEGALEDDLLQNIGE